MLRYRVLLVDTEGTYERPVQTFCNDIATVDDWAKKTLANKGKHAYVVVYRVTELEIGKIDQSAYEGKKRDKGSVCNIQPPSQEAD